MTALKEQVGGSHYKEMKIQPVEFCAANNLSFFQGSAIKYICRYRNKNGAQDIDKAIHFLELLKQLEYPKQESKPETFEPKDGDILCFPGKGGKVIFIFKKKTWLRGYYSHAAVVIRENMENLLRYDISVDVYIESITLATEQERQIIFNNLEKSGMRWNPEKKRIEDIPEEPKIGDYVIAWQNNRKNEAIVGVIDEKNRSLRLSPYRLGEYWYPNVVKWNGTLEHLEKVRRGEV